jgi:predicted acylesterase/phospholipase RssA
VFASRADNINNLEPTHFRTHSFGDDKTHNFKIWEAARATTAAPAYFERITLGDKTYVDGGLQANNPVVQAFFESRIVFGKARPIGCLLSIGTGLAPDKALRDNEGMFGSVRAVWDLGKSLMELATNSQVIHNNFQQTNTTGDLAAGYFRFNATGFIPGEEDKMVDLDDTGAIPKLTRKTETYVADKEVQDLILGCANTLNGLYRS